MSALARWQSRFVARLHDDDEPHPGFAAYRNTYRAQIIACMEETFPVLLRWLGSESFTALSIAYAQAHPPHSWSLDHFPAAFADWLAQSFEEALPAELARLEWALSLAFVARDEPVLSLAQAGEVDWDNAPLALAASAQWLALETPAAALWLSAQSGDPALPQGDYPAQILVWRREEQCHWRELAPVEAALLALLPASFGQICANACQMLGEESGIAQSGAYLAQWLGEGLLVIPA